LKGLLAPIMATTPYNSMVFTITETSKRMLEANESALPEGLKSDESKNFLSGMIAGGCGMILFNPVEVIKCRA